MTRIYHLHLKLPFRHKQTTDYYFSSMAAIYQQFTPEQLGISYGWLRHCKLKQGPYENEKIIVTLGNVSRKMKKEK
jgi:hypothetical protein